MKKRIILNCFDMTCVSHQAAGTWRHPSSQAWDYNTIDYWTNLAKELERGCFDTLFIADVVGVYDVYRGSAEAALKDAAQVPVNDPFGAISAMAAVTDHVGFGVTAAVTFEHPYLLARRLSTLDHLTKGRVAWNVVSSYLNSAALNIGMDKQIAHDERYDMAEEYMEVMYKLWEGSWETGAVHRNKETGVFTDGSKVHPIRHEGKYYKVPGFHLCEPSPQRTPVIFQAGASGRGRRFAARHAEGMFILATSVEQARAMTKDIRDLAEKEGRPRDSVKIFMLYTVITGATDEAAQRKYEEYLSYASPEGMLALYGGWTGLDFSQLELDEPLRAIENDSLRTTLESLTGGDGGKPWTVREVIRNRCIGGLGPVFVGGPKKVADELERWVDEGGIDGFNLAYAVTPGTTTDFIDYVVPELRKRGRVQTSYKDGTFRQKLVGTPDAYVEPSHPAANYRGAYAGKESVASSTIASKHKTPVPAE
ncbi:MAG: LLM class flavin-dependent oxidoreductase [Hyphomicrobium zavarzinii]|jgi:dimethyl-sulfide monooxygenase|uniref:LLM class flavin-dependent oxidoreductase n=1 Tax=Hyphomicrobium TaxID=81 RepID=UPI0003673F16|nr:MULTISPECIES: LLM class flavin-dependent oxidoreductase [Hyphomicrobium]MBL8844502.1 LLM class flavin-dependent oxidoreductase [Hyphomicrobium zavarzinii]WBT38746.1 LLM class flavin-dependent oxidoreductase [Hyphomicrobium sp. DMF-1]HML41840.1 LLM class flavin-dependent oxidoreductase [Hyphomicrobium zavarzinii]